MSRRPALVPDDQLGIVCPGIGVGALIMHPSDRDRPHPRFLFHLRGPQRTATTPGVRNDPHKWDMPGGGVEFGQRLADACIREVFEEHDITIPPSALTPLWVIEDLQYAPNGQLLQHWVSQTFLVTSFTGTPKVMEREKCASMAWLMLHNVATLAATNTTRTNLNLARTQRPDLF